MSYFVSDYEYHAPYGLIKTSKGGWRFISSLDDAEKIYDSIDEYLDRMGKLSDKDLLHLFSISVKSNTRDYGTPKYKIDVTSGFESVQRKVVARDFSRPKRKQQDVFSDVFASLEDTLEILKQSFNFFVKNGKFTEEDKVKNKELSEEVSNKIEELRTSFKDRFSKIFNEDEYISKKDAEDKKWFDRNQKEQEYKRQVENGILSWYRAMKKGEEEEKPAWWPYSRKKNPDYYKMIIDESTGEGTIYKLKDESDMDDDGRGYREFYAVCSDEIEKEVGKIPNADRKKAEEFIMGLDRKYDTIERTEPGWRFKTGFEDTGD